VCQHGAVPSREMLNARGAAGSHVWSLPLSCSCLCLCVCVCVCMYACSLQPHMLCLEISPASHACSARQAAVPPVPGPLLSSCYLAPLTQPASASCSCWLCLLQPEDLLCSSPFLSLSLHIPALHAHTHTLLACWPRCHRRRNRRRPQYVHTCAVQCIRAGCAAGEPPKRCSRLAAPLLHTAGVPDAAPPGGDPGAPAGTQPARHAAGAQPAMARAAQGAGHPCAGQRGVGPGAATRAGAADGPGPQLSGVFA